MLCLASAEVKGSPLWNLTPCRSLNAHCDCPCSFQSVASPGWSLPSGCRLVRLSKTLKLQRISLDAVLKWGSNFAMSPPCATTSSFFWVVCAWATLGKACDSAPATPRAAAPLSTSRRVTLMECTSMLGVNAAVCSLPRRPWPSACVEVIEQAVHGEEPSIGGGRERGGRWRGQGGGLPAAG